MVLPKKKLQPPIFLVILGIFIIYFLIKNISGSVFLKNKDRINIVFYSENSSFFSLSKHDVNYLINFPSSIEVLVPGGYGKYKVGAIGKLISLENKYDLFNKVFSGATSSFVDLYFYPGKTEIYYENLNNSSLPKIDEILLSKSNANFVDRLFLLSKLVDRNQSNYKIISLDKALFDQDQFNKDFQGSFYKKSYRKIGSNVQIIYTKSYSTAYFISQIINGEGIRVVDLSQSNENAHGCQIITKKIDLVGQALKDFFGCSIKVGETPVSDIILKLGSLEKDWAVK
ncbi:hypothetical protein HZA76_00975 [Candidatus Roizmanbacteria bacterium]|nr:hypothetical protein [Candidatus Roizmanbacteria bacterium]